MILSFVSHLWNNWNIRGVILLSLLLQVSLNLFAPLRRKTANAHVFLPLWLAYSIADLVAIYGIGVISRNQGNSSSSAPEIDGSVQAFWASFLLLHIGSQDNMTAYSQEDSSVWPRYTFNLIFQICVAIYVFVQIFLSDKSLVIPTMLVFLAGVTKIMERILALLLSSVNGLIGAAVAEYNLYQFERLNLVEEISAIEDGYPDEEEAKLPESITVKHALYFFRFYVVFLGGFIVTSEQRRMSCEYFRRVSAMDALRVISAELQFMYELLHTKARVLHFKCFYILRFIAFTEVAIAFVMFNSLKKHRLPKLDVKITYVLLFGGIASDVITLFMFGFSDWTVAKIKRYNIGRSKLISFLSKLISVMDYLRKPRFATREVDANNSNVTYAVLDTPFVFRRWSESISACNLFSEFLKERPRKMFKGIKACRFQFRAEKIASCFHQVGGRRWRPPLFAAGIIVARPTYVSRNPFIKSLWIFIFKEVRRKSTDDPMEVRKIFEARGDWFLRSSQEGIDLLEYITEANYGSSILIWHIASEIWYNAEQPKARNDEREFSKILSDYMLYLLFYKYNVMSAVTSYVKNIITFADTLFELGHHVENMTPNLENLCRQLSEEPPRVSPEAKCLNSVLDRGTDLAREMRRLGDSKWTVMSRVWVELLSYAAIHIEGMAHARVLTEGGELLAFVWLLMAHLGCFVDKEWGISSELQLHSPRVFASRQYSCIQGGVANP